MAISVAAHLVLFLLIKKAVIFEYHFGTRNNPQIIEIVSNDAAETLIIEDDIPLQEPEKIEPDFIHPNITEGHEQGTAHQHTHTSNLSTLAQMITSSANMHEDFSVFIPEGVNFNFQDITTGLGSNWGSQLGSASISATQDNQLSSTVNFFGIPTDARKIMFIIDHSHSMIHKGRLELLKEQLVRSIERLETGNKVAIVCFAGKAWNWGTPMKKFTIPLEESNAIRKSWRPSAPQWITITDETKSLLLDQIQNMSADQLAWDTNWTEGISLGMKLSPEPETIFFMTDGQVNPRQLPTFASQTQSWKNRAIPVNGVFLGSQPQYQVDEWKQCLESLKAAAESTSGVFKHVTQ